MNWNYYQIRPFPVHGRLRTIRRLYFDEKMTMWHCCRFRCLLSIRKVSIYRQYKSGFLERCQENSYISQISHISILSTFRKSLQDFLGISTSLINHWKWHFASKDFSGIFMTKTLMKIRFLFIQLFTRNPDLIIYDLGFKNEIKK